MSMPRVNLRAALIAALLCGAVGCGGSDELPTEPPPTTSVTVSFADVLTPNGARTHTFTVTGAGGITALLADLDPEGSAKPVGLSLGTWNGSICQIVLANDASIQGSVVVGQTTAIGDFCVRIYDAAGTLVGPQPYVIEVSHQVSNQ